MVKSWIAKDAPSLRGNRSQQERFGIVGSFRRTLRDYRATWPRKCLQYGRDWLVFSVTFEIFTPNDN
jgi:hypothetical protein